MKAGWWLVALVVGALLLACSNPTPEPTKTPLIQVCIEDGEKVPCRR